MFSFPEAAQHLKTPLLLPSPTCYVSGASIDTRTLELGNLFVAIQGQSQNGHAFLEDAFLKGAAGALINKSFYESHTKLFEKSKNLFQNLLVVEDTSAAFLELANWYRKRVNPVCVGITGSVGKTSTKEFLYYLLKDRYPVLASKGNHNNHLGLPLTLLSLQPRDRYCISELGANHVGEIAALAKVLEPSRAILTGVSPAHLKGFGSLEAIYDAKLELIASLKPRSFAILNSDDDVLLHKARKYEIKKIPVGFSDRAERRVTRVRVKKGYVHFCLDGQHEFAFPGIAPFMAQNAAMALVMAEILGVSLSEIPKKWKNFSLPSGRFAMKEVLDSVSVIDDSYNANPYSFEKAVEAFASIETTGKKYLVLADMLELGYDEKKWHAKLGEVIANSAIDYVAAYGALSAHTLDAIRSINKSVETEYFKGPMDLGHALREKLKSGDSLLLKASRGMRIERVLEALQGDSLEKV